MLTAKGVHRWARIQVSQRCIPCLARVTAGIFSRIKDMWVIISKQEIGSGHGSTDYIPILAHSNCYEPVKTLFPMFNTEEEAKDYIAKNGKSWNRYEAVRLEIFKG